MASVRAHAQIYTFLCLLWHSFHINLQLKNEQIWAPTTQNRKKLFLNMVVSSCVCCWVFQWATLNFPSFECISFDSWNPNFLHNQKNNVQDGSFCIGLVSVLAEKKQDETKVPSLIGTVLQGKKVINLFIKDNESWSWSITIQLCILALPLITEAAKKKKWMLRKEAKISYAGQCLNNCTLSQQASLQCYRGFGRDYSIILSLIQNRRQKESVESKGHWGTRMT